MWDSGGGSYMADGAAPATSYGGESFNAGPYATVAGGLLSAYSQYSAGKQNRATARFNAEYARIQAAQALEAGKFEQSKRDEAARLAMGSTRASQAAGGTVVGAGTNRAVLDSIQGASEMDKLLIEINARRQAYGYRVAAADQTARGEIAYDAGRAGAVSTLLDTGARTELETDMRYRGRTGAN